MKTAYRERAFNTLKEAKHILDLVPRPSQTYESEAQFFRRMSIRDAWEARNMAQQGEYRLAFQQATSSLDSAKRALRSFRGKS